MRKLLFTAFLVLSLSACSTPGPMQTKYGLIQTNAFDPLFLSSASASPPKVDYKTFTFMFRENCPMMSLLKDFLVITDRAVYLSEWDIENHTFIHKLKLQYSEINAVSATVEERRFLPDSQYLKIVTKNELQYNFAILDGSVDLAKSIIDERIAQ